MQFDLLVYRVIHCIMIIFYRMLIEHLHFTNKMYSKSVDVDVENRHGLRSICYKYFINVFVSIWFLFYSCFVAADVSKHSMYRYLLSANFFFLRFLRTSKYIIQISLSLNPSISNAYKHYSSSIRFFCVNFILYVFSECHVYIFLLSKVIAMI